jgi:PKD repeat protein
MQRILSIALAFYLTAFSLFSQTSQVNQRWCGSVEAMEAHFKKHPELRQQFEQLEMTLNHAQNTGNPVMRTAAVDYTIPVVFHVLHQNGIENISDAQIQDQVAIFNRDFNLQNTDTSLVIAPMKSAIGNAHITFVLAKLDPNGNCTSGIDRFFDAKTNSWEGDYFDYQYTWDPTMYLNIYVVKGIESGAAGYAYYPGSLGTGSPMDAILILQDYVGSVGTSSALKSRALTHEVGHWLRLQHVWGNSNNPGVACGDDQVNDTPVTKGFTSCSSLINSQICTPGVSENYQNYMDYAYCSVMFTNDQVIRMTGAITSTVSGRNNLSSVSNLMATGITPPAQCAPSALFKSDKQIICMGQTISYTDQSNIASPTSWAWNFEGGTPNTSSVQNPTITYNSPGTYSVQLISSNLVGNSTPEVKVGYVIVLPAPTSTAIYESFETGTLPNSIWMVRNSSASNTNWQQTTNAAASGNHSAFISQTITAVSTVDLYSPAYDLTSMPNVALTFKWAGAERDTTTHASFDSFSVFFSTDCGVSWIPRFNKQLKVGNIGLSGIVNGNFYPTPSQFRQEVINLGSLASSTNAVFRIRFTSESGESNNFYIDDINLSTITSLKETTGSLLNFELFPNPATENVTVALDLPEDKKIEITLVDILGRTVSYIDPQTLTNGNHEINIAVSDLAKGVYFVQINMDHISSTKKIIIE